MNKYALKQVLMFWLRMLPFISALFLAAGGMVYLAIHSNILVVFGYTFFLIALFISAVIYDSEKFNEPSKPSSKLPRMKKP